jgi:hypothetical protein
MHYEVISKMGKHTRFPDITSLQAVLSADTNTLISRRIHVISIIKSESASEPASESASESESESASESASESESVNTHMDDWYFKPISESWYPESESRLAELSSEYRQMIQSNTPNHVWVFRNYNTKKMQNLNYKLHITKDIDIYEYRKQFDAISIEKVINHNDFMALLCESGNNSPL